MLALVNDKVVLGYVLCVCGIHVPSYRSMCLCRSVRTEHMLSFMFQSRVLQMCIDTLQSQDSIDRINGVCETVRTALYISKSIIIVHVLS